MEYNFRGIYSSSGSYVVKDVVSLTVNNVSNYYFCLQPNSSSNAQSPSPNGDTQYWGLINALSNFPNSIDTFITRNPIQYNDKPYLQRFQELSLKSVLTNAEQNELAQLTQALRDKLILPEDWNKLQQSISNLQMFFSTEITAYWQSVKDEINQTKVDALQAIEDKKQNVILYLDGTTAGALRNDIGDMSELGTAEKDSLVDAVNELKTDLSTLESTTESALQNHANDSEIHITEQERNDWNNKITLGDLPLALTNQRGIVQLTDSVNSTSTTTAPTANALSSVRNSIPALNSSVTSTSTIQAATPFAVKIAYDKANSILGLPSGGVGGQFVAMGSNGQPVWVDPSSILSNRLLYSNGDNYIEWEAYGSAIISNSYMSAYTGHGIYTKNTVDLTGWNAIKITLSCYDSDYASNTYFIASTSKSTSSSTYTKRVSLPFYNYGASVASASTVVVSVADLTGYFYLNFQPFYSNRDGAYRIYAIELVK